MLSLDESQKKLINEVFKPLRAKKSFSAASLSDALLSQNKIRKERKLKSKIDIDPMVASLFGSAAIDMWHRAVHSLIISASLTEASPIWASVSGYYSSHYTIRGLAHLFGFFQLYHDSLNVHLTLKSPSAFVCEFIQKEKGGKGGEHKSYWNIVKQISIFQEDTYFTKNEIGQKESDVAHRNYANYIDHLRIPTTIGIKNKEWIKMRIDEISNKNFDIAPIPSYDKFPDTMNVQIVAYYRIIQFRKILDETIIKNKYWLANREPDFAKEYFDYQLPISEIIK